MSVYWLLSATESFRAALNGQLLGAEAYQTRIESLLELELLRPHLPERTRDQMSDATLTDIFSIAPQEPT